MFGREFHVRLVKPYDKAKALADSVIPERTLDPTQMSETAKELVFYTVYTVTAGIVISTVTITAGRILTAIVQSKCK